MKTKEINLPDSEVNLKLSLCSKCDGIVRTAVEHMMNTKSKNEFLKEVMEYELKVSSMPLIQFRKDKPKWCKCK